jgi:hypothetical protein
MALPPYPFSPLLSLQGFVFFFRFNQYGLVGVGVYPEGEAVLVLFATFRSITTQRRAR